MNAIPFSRAKKEKDGSDLVGSRSYASRLGVELFPCGVLSQRIWLNAWSRMGERDCWAKRNIAASVKEGAIREKARTFGRLAPIATRDVAGLPNQPQRTRQLRARLT